MKLQGKAGTHAQGTHGARSVEKTPLYYLRTKKGWTGRKAAQQAGVTYKTYAKVEHGDTEGVRMRTVSAIAKAFGVPVSKVLGRGAAVTQSVRRGHEAAAADRIPPPEPLLVTIYPGIVDDVQDAVVRVVFGEEGRDTWLIPIREIPEEGRFGGACLELRVYRYGPGDVRGRLVVIPPPPLTAAQRDLIRELERIDRGE